MDGLPVTVRLLDPPLHEFLPHGGAALDRLCEQLATELHVSRATVRQRLDGLREANPMLGLRGCRLGIMHHDITAMQVGGTDSLSAAGTVPCHAALTGCTAASVYPLCGL
jgi:phosphoenolpyruvate synthase/pyruvate phosphate dikinase